jgi:hypothetical protein
MQINLPKDLLAKAKLEAMRTGHRSLQAFLLHLIHEGLVRASVNDSKSAAAILRKAKASIHTVRPPARIPVRGKGVRAREPVQKTRKRLLDGMVSYMRASEDPGFGYACGYRLKDIDRCAAVVDAFLTELSAIPKAQPELVLRAVKHAVLKLNKLNFSCNGALIETDQREDLCKLISTAAAKKGLELDGDITEPWREW